MRIIDRNKAFLFFLLLISLSQCQDLMCPATTGAKKNIVEESSMSVPQTFTYKYASLQRDGAQIYELTARVQPYKLYLEMLKKDMTLVQQYKEYPAPLQIIMVKNQLTIVKVYTSPIVSYHIVKFDKTTAMTNKLAEIVFDFPITMPYVQFSGNTVLLDLYGVLSWKHDNQTLNLVLGHSNETFIYTLNLASNVLERAGKIPSIHLSGFDQRLSGNKNLIYDKITRGFFTLDENLGQYVLTSTSSVIGSRNIDSSTLKVGQIQWDYTGYFWSDSTLQTATLVVTSNILTNVWIQEFSNPNNDVKFYQDELSNVIVYSPTRLVWLNLQFNPQSVLKYSQTVTDATPATTLQIINDFNSALQLCTSDQWAYALNSNTINYYQIRKLTTAVVIVKHQSFELSNQLKYDLSKNKVITVMIAFKCLCATPARPKLVCLTSNLSCFAMTRMKMTECTVKN